jgi:hypothetical protein
MNDSTSPFDVFRIEQEIRSRNPAVVFASPRTIRRVIRAERGLPVIWPRIPHRESVVIAGRRLADLVDDFWAFPADLPETILLVARPDADRFQAAGIQALLREYWRLVFHATLDGTLARQDAAARERMASSIPRDVIDEARFVLGQEQAVPRDAADRDVIAEFIAVFLELRAFAPDAVAAWFPSLADADALADALGTAIDAGGTFDATRPPALPDDVDPARIAAFATAEPDRRPVPPRWGWSSRSALRRGAERSSRRGNLVRAALDEWRADAAENGLRGTGVDQQADAFARRLCWALDLGTGAIGRVTAFVRRLVDASGGSAWTPQARLLFDLQKVCVDSERESYRTQLIAWVVTLGRQPLTKPLPCQRLVLIHRHAVQAAKRLPSLRLPHDERLEAEDLLDAAVATTGLAAREALEPRVGEAIREAGLVPGCLVEQAAFDTLVDELLDGILGRGFISFGNLRDAVSRNQLKLPDLAGIAEWAAGDPLLRADRGLGERLDGAYRPAPLYLAALQRLSAPFFGVSWGRLLTTHLLLPFGAAWIILRGVEHVVEPITEYSLGETWHVYTTARMLAIGLLLWALMHVPAVRAALARGLRLAGAAAHFAAVVLPARILALPVVAAVLQSLPVAWFRRHVASPLLVTLAAWLCLPHHGGLLSRSTPWLPPVWFAISAAVLNSRIGRLAQERVVEGVGRTVHHLHIHVLTGLFAWIVDAFRRAVDVVEGTLYAVDEQLRFRSDESTLTLAVKSVLAAAWSVVDACVRFGVTLLIEPQLNPIKHFPVVTVSHKLLVPMIPVVSSQLVAATGMEKGLALTAVTFVSTCIPGIFGFLAWELKENWRLYAANRPRTLRPVQVGHHGETVRRLLLPGFHSGTIPKLFARLRAGRDAVRPGGARAAKAEHLLHELEGDVAEFIAHECLGLLERTADLEGAALRVAAVNLAVGRITVVVAAEAIGSDPLVIVVERHDGRIVSRVARAGWLDRLPAPRQRPVRLAIAGLHRLVGADLATAAFVAMPGSGDAAAPPESDGLAEVPPIAWTDWRDAWEREADR